MEVRGEEEVFLSVGEMEERGGQQKERGEERFRTQKHREGLSLPFS